MQKANAPLLRKVNQSRIRQALWKLREATKYQLAQETGLSQMTVNNVLAGLQENGEAEEEGRMPSEGGRPSTLYRYRGSYGHALALYSFQDRGRSLVRLHVIDLLGNCVYQDNAWFNLLQPDSFGKMLEKAFQAVAGIRLIGFGLPGEAVGEEITLCDHKTLLGTELLQGCRKKYGVPAVFYNDINATVYGYYRRLFGEGNCSYPVSGIYFPRNFPPGMGLIINGSPYLGHCSFAGEIGSLPFGTDWFALDYEDRDQVRSAVGDLLAIVCSVAAPGRCALYGDFFIPEDREPILERARTRLGGGYEVFAEILSSPEKDYELGIEELLLRALRRQLFGDPTDWAREAAGKAGNKEKIGC